MVNRLKKLHLAIANNHSNPNMETMRAIEHIPENEQQSEIDQEKYLRQATHYFCGIEKPLKNGPVAHTLTELIAGIYKEFESSYVNIEMVNHLLLTYQSNPKEWQKYAKFDRYKYTRNLVDAGNGRFNLMILCWGEGHCSPIHDHSDSHCFMKMLKGDLREIRYKMPDDVDPMIEMCEMNVDGECEKLEEIGSSIMSLNDVAYINDNLGLHRVENPSHSDTAVSLHLYCPPFDSCHLFQENSGKKMKCCVTFWSQYGEKLNSNK